MANLRLTLAPLTEPSSTQALTGAASWLQGTMLGSVATIVAVLAVAAVGMGLFTGRLSIRRGMTLVVGCFVLFGSAAIASALMALIAVSPAGEIRTIAEAPSPLPPPLMSNAVPYDPYAGASVARR